MFLRKLHNIPDKVKWLSLELLVVFIGVYLAFVFQSYSEQQAIDKEREKVFVSLKKELDQLRMELPRFADFQEGKVQEWDSIADGGKVAPFYGWRYIEPQYNFRVIEYAIDLEGIDIIDFDLYESILELYSTIKKLEHAERLMTEYAGRYKNIPTGIDKSSDMAKVLEAENRLMFFKFRVFAGDRTGNLRRVAELAQDIVDIINEKLGPAKTREVDITLLKLYLEADLPENFVKESFEQYFPQYSYEEMKKEAIAQ